MIRAVGQNACKEVGEKTPVITMMIHHHTVIIIRIDGKRATLAERRKVLEESLLIGGCVLTKERWP